METKKTLSGPDFYVRLQEAAFAGRPLRHVQSELERKGDENLACTWEGASASVLCGCTEWVALTEPQVSIGWDWVVSPTGEMRLNPHSIRTNLMLVDEHRQDLGLAPSVEAVRLRVERCEWQPEVLAALQDPPSIST